MYVLSILITGTSIIMDYCKCRTRWLQRKSSASAVSLPGKCYPEWILWPFWPIFMLQTVYWPVSQIGGQIGVICRGTWIYVLCSVWSTAGSLSARVEPLAQDNCKTEGVCRCSHCTSDGRSLNQDSIRVGLPCSRDNSPEGSWPAPTNFFVCWTSLGFFCV